MTLPIKVFSWQVLRSATPCSFVAARVWYQGIVAELLIGAAFLSRQRYAVVLVPFFSFLLVHCISVIIFFHCHCFSSFVPENWRRMVDESLFTSVKAYLHLWKMIDKSIPHETTTAQAHFLTEEFGKQHFPIFRNFICLLKKFYHSLGSVQCLGKNCFLFSYHGNGIVSCFFFIAENNATWKEHISVEKKLWKRKLFCFEPVFFV